MRQQAKEWRGVGRGPGRLQGFAPCLVGFLLAWGLAPTMLLAAVQVTPPDKVISYPGTSLNSIAVSADGRVVAGLEGSARVWIFDSHNTGTFGTTETLSTSVDLTGCSPSSGVFVGENLGQYVVHLPCSDGSIVQFAVSDNETTTSLKPLAAGASTKIEKTTLNLVSISAAALDADSEFLYVVGRESDTTSPIVVMVDATSVGGTHEPIADFLTEVSVSKLAVTPAGILVAADADGALFVSSTSGVMNSTPATCEAIPKDLLVIDDKQAIFLGYGQQVSVITMTTSSLECTHYEWGLSGATSVTRVETLEKSYLYLNGNTADSSVAVYELTDNLADDLEPVASLAIPEFPSGVTHMAAAAELGLIFVASTQGLAVLSAGPTLTLSYDDLTTPPLVEQDSESITVTLTSDEVLAEGWCSSVEPPGSSVTNECELSTELVAETPKDLKIDLSSLNLSLGLNTVYLYGQDADGNTGWTSILVNRVDPPAALENFTVQFGNQRLYLYFDPPDDETVDGYEILFTTKEFEVPISDAALQDEWNDALISVTVTNGEETVEYPGSTGWPFALEAKTEESVWGVEDEQLKYTLMPLQNGIEYFVTIRATASGVGGDWSPVESGKPEETCGAACAAEDLGGFCSIASVSSRHRGTSSPLLAMSAVVVVRILYRRRRRAADISGVLLRS